MRCCGTCCAGLPQLLPHPLRELRPREVLPLRYPLVLRNAIVARASRDDQSWDGELLNGKNTLVLALAKHCLRYAKESGSRAQQGMQRLERQVRMGNGSSDKSF